MASQYDIDIKIDVESASLGELETELGRLNDELKQIPRNSAEFNKAAGNIRKVTAETEKASKKLQSINVGELVGDFAKVGAAIGALSIAFNTFGEEGSASNEAIQKTLQQTQAILALVAVAEGVVSAAKLASAAATKVQELAQKAANVATKQGAISLKTLKAALISTGIGAFVVLLGEIVANFDAIQDFFRGGKKSERDAYLEAYGQAATTSVSKYDEALKRLEGSLAAGLVTEEEYYRKRSDLLKARQEEVGGYLAEQIRVKEEERAAAEEAGKSQYELAEIDEEIYKLRTARQNEINAVIKGQNDLILKTVALREEEYDKAIQLREAEEGFDPAEVFELRKESLENSITELQRYGDRYLDEIRELEFQITLLTRKEEARRQREAKERAEKRRDRIKAELEEIATIIEQEPTIALQKLGDEEERALAILEKYSGGSRDITKIIKELEKEGLTPLANQFKALADEGNFEEFDALVRKFFGNRFKDVISSAVQSLLAFQSEFPSVAATIQRFSKDFSTIIEQSLVNIDQPDGSTITKILQERVSVDTGEAISILRKSGDDLVKELENQRTVAANALTKLFQQGLLSEEEYEKQLNLILSQTQASIEQINNEVASGVGQILATSFQQIELANQQLINAAERGLAELQQPYIGFEGFLRALRDDRVQDEIDAQREILKARQQALEDQKAEIKRQAQEGVITQAQAAAQIQAIDQELFNNQMEQTKLLNDERIKGLEAALEIYDALRDTIQATSDLIGQQAELDNARLDVRIARTERDLELQLEGIDNEEERARATAQAEEKITQLKNEQIRNTAEAQKKQANLSMALAISEITVQTSLAIMKALAQLGPIAGPIAAGLIATTGALQIATAIKARNTAFAQADASLAGISGGGADGGSRTQFADGGYVSGEGGPTSDSIPAMLSDGEFVINAASTKRYLPLLEEINNTPRGYAMGGLVRPPGYFVGGLVGGVAYATQGIKVDEQTLEVLKKLDTRLEKPLKSYVVSSEIQEGLDSDAYLERRAQIT